MSVSDTDQTQAGTGGEGGGSGPVETDGGGSGTTLPGLVMLLLAFAAVFCSAVVYWLGGGTQALGGLLAGGLLLGGAGIVWWARVAMPEGGASGPREELPSAPEDREAFAEDFVAGEQSVARRRVLGGALLALGAGLAAWVVSLVRSFGRDPGPVLSRTAWTPGARLVTAEGRPVQPGDVPPGEVLVVWPEGHTDAYYAQTMLIHPQGTLQLPAGDRGGTPQGLVAYSRVCTHAGCPVGLYEKTKNLLLCPCHQSTFDVLRGAVPTGGPAARPLPQLPLAVDGQGYLVATGDYPVPVGPGYWSLP